ncbi:tetratricopeptide repeat protein [Flexithrix dorotheae]|uniref:tetratricopeptide repeat protein n=1 Tax=Flexithrix dorotheae TaxID=70993 RepID=UPI0012F9680A|nr:tetratricopeptide repeat protein [Flexithrix dorotheae]
MKKLMNRVMLYACMIFFLAPFFASAQDLMPVTVDSKQAHEIFNEAFEAGWVADFGTFTDNLEMALETDPDFFIGNLYAAMWYKNIGDMERFEEYANKAIEQKENLNEDEQHLCAGLELMLNDKAKEATPHFEVVAANYPKDFKANAYHGFQLFLAGEYEQSIAQLDKMLVIRPEMEPMIHNMKGYNYLKAEQFEKAEASFDKYIELNPDHPNPYDSKGDYFMAVKDFANAVEMFNKAYEMDNENFEFSKQKADQAKKMMEGN